MLFKKSIITLSTAGLLLALFTISAPVSAGFSSAKSISQNSGQSKTRAGKTDLYQVKDRHNRGNRENRLHKKHRRHRHNRRSRTRLFISPPYYPNYRYYPYYGPAWGYPPRNYYYNRRPRSGITFYFGN